MKYDILIVGVGGQGTVLASRLIAAAAMEQGWFVRTAETIGMAQRGGCVTSHVRIGSEQKSSMIPPHTADLLIGFEPGEALRNRRFLAPDGKLIVNSNPIMPVTASLSTASYDVPAVLSALSCAVLVDAVRLAREAGSEKTVNTVLLGAAVGYGLLPFDAAAMEAVIAKTIPQRFLEINRKAFALGRQLD